MTQAKTKAGCSSVPLDPPVGRLLLRCPKCRKEMHVAREPTDYPEAVCIEVTCPECNAGDFAEVMQFDADGRHIIRDPDETPNIEENLLENLITTFPGGLLPSDGEVVGGALDLAGQYVNKILYMRSEAAISGAMRWPWSQEARIDLTGGLRYA